MSKSNDSMLMRAAKSLWNLFVGVLAIQASVQAAVPLVKNGGNSLCLPQNDNGQLISLNGTTYCALSTLSGPIPCHETPSANELMSSVSEVYGARYVRNPFIKRGLVDTAVHSAAALSITLGGVQKHPNSNLRRLMDNNGRLVIDATNRACSLGFYSRNLNTTSRLTICNEIHVDNVRSSRGEVTCDEYDPTLFAPRPSQVPISVSIPSGLEDQYPITQYTRT